MLSVREVGLVAQRELVRNLRSTKGIAMFALFFLGGLVPALVRMVVRRYTANMSDEMLRAGFEQVLAARYNDAVVVKYLADSPSVLYFLYEGTLMFLPLLILLIGFDQLAGDLRHRTLRYSAGRATRSSIVAGKALGIWGVITVMVTMLHVTVWAMSWMQGGQQAGTTLSWGGRLLVFSIVCSAAYVGFSSLVSALFHTPTVALVAGVGMGFALWLVYTSLHAVHGMEAAFQNRPNAGWSISEGAVKTADALTWLFPNRYEQLLVQPDLPSVFQGFALFVGWGALCVLASTTLVNRKDL